MRLDHLLSKEHDLNRPVGHPGRLSVECFQLRHSLVRLFRFEEVVIALLPYGALGLSLSKTESSHIAKERLLRIA